MKKGLLLCALLSFVFAQAGLSQETEKACEHDHDHEDAHAALQEVHVPPVAQKMIALQTVPVQKRPWRAQKSLWGRVVRAPDASFDASAPFAGFCSLRTSLFQHVSKGAPLFVIHARELTAREEEIKILEKRIASYTQLGLTNAELCTQLALKKSARAALVGPHEITNGAFYVRAPFGGQVSSLACNEGAYVEEGARVLTLQKPHLARVQLFASPLEKTTLTNGLCARVGTHQGTLLNGLSTDGSMRETFVVFSSPHDLTPGARVRVTIEYPSSDEPCTIIPREALVQIGLSPTVFVKNPDEENSFLAHPVEILHRNFTEVAVTGLDEAASVVTKGAYELKLALADGATKPAGHFHADGTFHSGDDEKEHTEKK